MKKRIGELYFPSPLYKCEEKKSKLWVLYFSVGFFCLFDKNLTKPFFNTRPDTVFEYNLTFASKTFSDIRSAT